MNISQKIYKLRKENGYSQEELAEKLKVPSRYIAYWEDGVTPELSIIVQLSDIFNVSTDYLLKDDVDDNVSEEVEGNNTDSDYQNVYTFIAYQKYQTEQIYKGFIYISLSIITFALYYYDIIENIQSYDLREFMKAVIIVSNSIIILLAVTNISAIKSKPILELNQDGELFLTREEKVEFYEMYRIFNSEKRSSLIVAVEVFIGLFLIGNSIIGFFNMGNTMRFIVVAILIIFVGRIVGLIVSSRYEKEGYETLIKYVGELEEELEEEVELELEERVEENSISQKSGDKKGVKILKSTETDEYINNRVKSGKSLGKGLIFLALGSIPFIPYFYSDGEIFNKVTLNNAPIVVWVISIICNLIALYFLIKLININNKFESKNNNDFILNEFSENKLKFNYKKFKNKKIAKIIMAVVIFTSAIMLTAYLVVMFNGAMNMYYGLLGVTMFLYGLATYCIITVKFEQKAYKVLLTNVD